MAHEIVMPQLGLSMSSGKIITWLKVDGDLIKTGDALFEVESDKATIAVEAVHDGVLSINILAGDQDIPVGAVIGYLLAPSEKPSHETVQPVALSHDEKDGVGITSSTFTPESISRQDYSIRTEGHKVSRLPSTPAARRLADDLGVDWRLATATGKRGQIKARDVRQYANTLTAVTASPNDISPLAYTLVKDLGIDYKSIQYQLPGKRIEREDVLVYVRQLLSEKRAAKSTEFSTGRVSSGTEPILRLEMKKQPVIGLRKIIAERMATSAHTVAPVTLFNEVDATALVDLRQSFKDDQIIPVTPSYNVLFAKIISLALLEHPDLNTSMNGDEIVYWDTVNIGIAVDSPRGLVVPVLRNVHARNLFDLASTAEELISRAKQGKALPDELGGGTFTITNLGNLGVDGFTPIINLPECAVLGVGRMQKKLAVMSDNTTVIRTFTTLSLTFDHRLVDGAPAARFLNRVCQFVHAPILWITRMTAF